MCFFSEYATLLKLGKYILLGHTNRNAKANKQTDKQTTLKPYLPFTPLAEVLIAILMNENIKGTTAHKNEGEKKGKRGNLV